MEEAGMFVYLSLPLCIFENAVSPIDMCVFLPLSLEYLQYVVVSSKKILFYNDEQNKEQSNPSMVLDIE